MTIDAMISVFTTDKLLKGQIVVIKDHPAVWGGKERLPNYVHAIITGTTAEDALTWMQKAKNAFTYSAVTAGGIHTVDISVSDAILAIGNGFKAEMRELILADYAEYEAALISWTPPNGPATFTFLDTLVLQDLKDDLLDKFEDSIGPRYLFPETDVDTVVSAGGEVEITKAQALNRIIDRYT